MYSYDKLNVLHKQRVVSQRSSSFNAILSVRVKDGTLNSQFITIYQTSQIDAVKGTIQHSI